MSNESDKRRITWYKSPLSRDALAALNERSDSKGLAQTLGYYGVLVLTGTAAWYAVEQRSWALGLVFIYLHGLVFAFLVNAFHEFCHQTVFKTKALNTFFLNLTSFLSWSNPVMFWASHQEHHKYTLHPPDDLEVVLPQALTWESFFKSLLINPWDFVFRFKIVVRLCFGKVAGRWEEILFPDGATEQRADLFRWARIILLGHLVIVAVSLYFGLWLIPVLVTLAPFYGGGLQYLCNNTQHVGLQDKVPDFRLCTRTFLTNPVLQFLYWHMNFHIEHHMYAAVPCYNLAQLHAAIKSDLPHCPTSLLAAWQEIIPIVKRQQADPQYQFIVALPAPHGR